MLWANHLIFALDPKLDMNAETLILHSGPKFLYLQQFFISTFEFVMKQKLLPKKFMPGFGQSQKSHLLKISFAFLTHLELCRGPHLKQLFSLTRKYLHPIANFVLILFPTDRLHQHLLVYGFSFNLYQLYHKHVCMVLQ